MGVEVMAEKTAWKAARVGSGEAAKVVGSAMRGWRRGLRERAGRLSMREAVKAAVARCHGAYVLSARPRSLYGKLTFLI